MEIRIDTSKDSKDDIRKMISFLERFVAEDTAPENSPLKQDIFSEESMPMFQPGAMGMFDAPSTSNRMSDSTNTISSAQELIDDSVRLDFEKQDDELEEVRKLKEKSETRSEDLRIISYK